MADMRIVYDLTCPWCGAQQKVPAGMPPFRFICGNCKDTLTYRSKSDYKRQYDEIQVIKRREPRWRELEIPVSRLQPK